jgi:glycosyltransferase involved in cell wall biosynthesis
MKILHVMAGGKHGGAETAFVDMCIAMQEAGMDIAVVTRANEGRVPPLEKAGIKVYTLPFGGPLDVFTGWKLSKIIREFSPLIVQTWMARAAQKTPNWMAVKTPIRYLVVARLGGYYKVKNFRSADYFAAITPDIKRHLMDGGIEPDKIRFIPNFAETENSAAPISRADLETPEGASIILCLGRLHTSKAYDVLIEAIINVPDVYVWIAGEGPERENLEAQAEAAGVASRIKFLGWRTDRSALLRAADICVFASRVEPFGTVFAQAWAEGTPVIVSDAEGPKQFCRDEQDSLIVPKENAPALAEAIKRLLADKALREKLVANGYQRYKGEFTKEKSVAAYLEYYLEILGREQLVVSG